MYTNENLDHFSSWVDKNEREYFQDKIKQIKSYYKKFNAQNTRYTERYKNAVISILDQFPIKVKKGITSDIEFSINNKIVSEANLLLEALDNYIKKFESIEYLDFLSEANRNIVFVGPNGCGKTTLLRKLQKDTVGASIQYFQADRVLLVNEDFTPKRSYDAFIKEFNNNYTCAIDINNNSQGLYIQKQFDYFINLLERERNEENEKREYNGAAEKIIKKWNNLIKDRELFFEHGLCIRTMDGEKYPLKYMSSGEKSILYFLIGILLQDAKDFYFIDEPENNLNPAIVSKLWNFIERERPNSVFVYLTHNSDFVASRINSKIYWIEKFDGTSWNWRQLIENKDLPQELMIELIGSREPIIFCESENEYKYDSKVFKLMFPDFKIVPSGGCAQVKSSVKAYKTTGLPQKVYGIVDCDYSLDEDLNSLIKDDIYHLPFFEIENFLLSEEVLKKMVETYCKKENKESVIKAIKKKVFDVFEDQKDIWITRHVAFDLRNEFGYHGKIKSLKNIDELKNLYEYARKSETEIDSIVQRYQQFHSEIISSDNYDFILRHLDSKGLIKQCNHIFEFENSIQYEDQVFVLLNSKQGDSILRRLRERYLPNIRV